MRVIAACAVLAAVLGCTAAWAFPKGMPYLPPRSHEYEAVAAAADQNPAANNTADQELLNRFGDDGIYFDQGAADDLRPQVLLEQQVHRDVSRGVAHLALSLDRALSETQQGRAVAAASPLRDNLIFSPLSVAAALALVLLGSGGRTYDEVSQVLGLTMNGSLTPERDNAIHQHFGRLLGRLTRRAAATDSSEALSAHGVFVQTGLPLRGRFQKVARQAYHSDVKELDFLRRPVEAQAAVNAWVKEKTRGRITDILAQPPPAATRLILGTALYFNGQWQHPFPKETTMRRPFYVDGDANGEIIQADMMANSADLPYAEDTQLRCKVLGLPYKGGDVVMYLVLPHERGIHALKALEASLTLDALDRLISSTRLESDVIVVLPRTKLEYSANLRTALQRLGVNTLFDAGAANLSQLIGTDEFTPVRARRGPAKDTVHFRGRRQAELSAQEPLYVDEVLHKVEVEITEMGTVASAATLATVTRDGSHRSVRADRPFLFFIRHEPTGLILFWGTVVRPRPAPPIV